MELLTWSWTLYWGAVLWIAGILAAVLITSAIFLAVGYWAAKGNIIPLIVLVIGFIVFVLPAIAVLVT